MTARSRWLSFRPRRVPGFAPERRWRFSAPAPISRRVGFWHCQRHRRCWDDGIRSLASELQTIVWMAERTRNRACSDLIQSEAQRSIEPMRYMIGLYKLSKKLLNNFLKDIDEISYMLRIHYIKLVLTQRQMNDAYRHITTCWSRPRDFFWSTFE